MKINKITIPLSFMMFVCTPLLTHAQVFDYIYSLISAIGTTLERLFPILVGLALIVFIWGMVKFIANSGDEKALTEGKQKMIWGVIALFVIISVWGIVVLLQTISGVGSGPSTLAPPAIL